MSAPILAAHNLMRTFTDAPDAPIVNDVSLSVEHGEILALIGPSGCGKTTTLRMLAGLERLDSGRIEIAGRVVGDGRLHIPTEKRNIGLVFQDYAIFPHLTVWKNVAFGLGRAAAKKRVADMLALVGLAGLGDRMPHELSGGQQQRVALARALAPEPVVLLLDEPFSNLDASLRDVMRHDVRDLLRRADMTAIFVTHDQEEALFMGDQIAVMNNGRLEQTGSPETIYHRPRTRFVAEFMGQSDFMPGVVHGDFVTTPLGDLPNHHDFADGEKVDIVLRPDDVLLQPAPDGRGNGRILDRQFVGIANIYRIQLHDGTIIHSWQLHSIQIADGDPVRVVIMPGQALPSFARP